MRKSKSKSSLIEDVIGYLFVGFIGFLIVVGPALLVSHHENRLGWTHNVRYLAQGHVVVESTDDWFGGTTIRPYWALDGKWTDKDGKRCAKDAIWAACNEAVRREIIKRRSD